METNERLLDVKLGGSGYKDRQGQYRNTYRSLHSRGGYTRQVLRSATQTYSAPTPAGKWAIVSIVVTHSCPRR